MSQATLASRIVRRLTTCVLVPGVILLVAPGSSAAAADKELVQPLPSEPISLDPAKVNNIQADTVMWLLYDRLTQMSADGSKMEPALAEQWEQSADGLTYTFKLRRNAVFHDGTPVDADAVKVSYERQFLPTSPFYSATPPNAYERVLQGLIKEIKVLDAHTVAITLHYQRPHQFALVSIVSPHALKRFGGPLTRTPVGTGPFRLDRWESDRIVLAPFADSWRGRPQVSHLTFVIIPESQAIWERLENGDFDLVREIAPQRLERLAANPYVRLVKTGGLNLRFLGMQLDRGPLKDRRVREAIVRAIDLERLATHSGRGTLLAAQGPLPPKSLGYDSQIRQPVYDPARARALLQQAGAPATLTLRLLYNASLEYWSESVQAIRADLRKAGVGIELVGVRDWKTFHEERVKGLHDLYLYQWAVSTPDPERFLFPLFQSKSPDNYGAYSNPRVDDLLAQARQPMDEGKRVGLYREVARLVVADVPAVFLFHHITFTAHSARLSGLNLNLYGWPQDKLTTVEIR